MNHRQHDGEIGIKQPFDRFGHDAHLDQCRIDQAIAPQHRDPRNHPDDVRGQERHGADKKQDGLGGGGLDMEGQKIGHPEANHQGDRPDNHRIFDGVEIGLPRHPGTKRFSIVEGDEVGIHAGKVIVPKAYGDDHGNGQQQKAPQNDGQRQCLQIGGYRAETKNGFGCLDVYATHMGYLPVDYAVRSFALTVERFGACWLPPPEAIGWRPDGPGRGDPARTQDGGMWAPRLGSDELVPAGAPCSGPRP